jgi:hypothetical protein
MELAKKTFQDNYVEYEMTGDPKYKKISDQAKLAMDNILHNMESFENMKEIHDNSKTILSRNISQKVPEVSLTYHYVGLGLLAATMIGLMMF